MPVTTQGENMKYIISLLLLAATTSCFPEIVIHTKDGRSIRVQVDASEINSIDFSPSAASTNNRSILGEWVVSANNYPGKMILEQRADGLHGKFFINANNEWEELKDVRFDQSTLKLTFTRPKYSQYYTAVLTNGRFTGTHTMSGVTYGFEAWR